jgi:hypothetical protein
VSRSAFDFLARFLLYVTHPVTWRSVVDPNRKARLLANGRCYVAKIRCRKTYIALNRSAVGSLWLANREYGSTERLESAIQARFCFFSFFIRCF